MSVKVVEEGRCGVFTPFNSLVLEILADSKALVVASTAAMIAVDLKKPLKIRPEVLCSLRDLSLSHCLASIFETELKHI